jgi:hypothetical protein
LIHLARRFQRRSIFRNQPIRNKNDLWWQGELLLSLGVRRPLTFHILIFSSETPQLNELKFGRKHLWKVLYKVYVFYVDQKSKMAATAIHRLTLDPMGK